MEIEEVVRQVSKLSDNVQELVSVSVQSTTEIKGLKQEVVKLRTVVSSGNGQAPLTTRMALVEEKQNAFLRKLDRFFWLVISGLGTALIALFLQVIKKII